jgi:hypothetical protein
MPALRFRAAAVTPLAPERYKLQVTLARETHDKLRRAQALFRHLVSDGEVGSILDRALTLLIDDLERRMFARVTSTRPSRGDSPAAGRHISAAVRRAVWERNEGRCAFIGRTGRCRETAFLEFHHVTPYAAGSWIRDAAPGQRCGTCDRDPRAPRLSHRPGDDPARRLNFQAVCSPTRQNILTTWLDGFRKWLASLRR